MDAHADAHGVETSRRLRVLALVARLIKDLRFGDPQPPTRAPQSAPALDPDAA